MSIDNPVLRRELLLRMRLSSHHRATRLTICILIVCAVLMFYMLAAWAILQDSSPGRWRGYWQASIGLQVFLICLLSPSAAANAITQEREQQTWEMLVFTRLRPSEILLGKLVGRLSTLLIVLAIFVPITAICALCSQTSGSPESTVGVIEFTAGYVTLLAIGLFYTAVSLFLSLRLRRTVYATMAAYTFVVGFLCMGTFMAEFIIDQFVSGAGDFWGKSPLLWFNPIRMTMAMLNLDSPDSGFALACGVLGYLAATLFLMLYMVTRFRHYAEE
jgi:ABC-type transport system involved in multi-copper enzyme maturation permease subunit